MAQALKEWKKEPFKISFFKRVFSFCTTFLLEEYLAQFPDLQPRVHFQELLDLLK
ncbi:MAG: hypothetical protein ACLRPQ_04560 [Streptococcus sp.]